jgi:hypothetical protein
MARRRYVSTKVSTDLAVNKLAQESDFAALLYTWLIPHCEDDGLLPSGDPEEVLAMVVPMRRDKTSVDISDALALMEKLQLVIWHDDCIEFDPVSFYEYQSYIKADRRRTTPHICACPRHSTQNTAVPRTSTQNTASVSLSPSLSPSPSFSVSPPTPQPATKVSTMMRDPVYRTLVELFGDPGKRRTEFDDAWSYLVSVDATPETVRDRTARLTLRWSDGKREPFVFGPGALAKHWPSFDGELAKVTATEIESHSDEQRRLKRRQEAMEADQRKALP